jgi:hypothetical protein
VVLTAREADPDRLGVGVAGVSWRADPDLLGAFHAALCACSCPNLTSILTDWGPRVRSAIVRDS